MFRPRWVNVVEQPSEPALTRGSSRQNYDDHGQ
jgi:hypothetical protein